MVKVVDLATAVVLLATGVLAFLLTAAVVEHWLVPGGFPSRCGPCCLGCSWRGAGYFAYRRLWPLCVRAINPVYAAQTIEHGSPSLKNSLINLLLFRQRRTEISDAVYQTLEEQAAQRLTRVPVDTAVDRIAIDSLGLRAAWPWWRWRRCTRSFSPKDPLVAAERVLMPWADIVPASRVSITAIEPGRLTISRGEFVDVSAEVRGIGDDDAVRAAVHDGRWPGRRQADSDEAGADGLRFSCRLARCDRGERLGGRGAEFDVSARGGRRPVAGLSGHRGCGRLRSWWSGSSTTTRPTRATWIGESTAWATSVRSRARGSRFTPGPTGRFDDAQRRFRRRRPPRSADERRRRSRPRRRSNWRCATIGRRRDMRATCCGSRTTRAARTAIRSSIRSTCVPDYAAGSGDLAAAGKVARRAAG